MSVLHEGLCHKGAVAKIQKRMSPDETLRGLAEIFKILGDHTRVRILQALSFSELNVCCIADLLSMSHSSVSHQLRILRAWKIVKYRKEGRHVFYSLDDHHIDNLMREGLEHVRHG